MNTKRTLKPVPMFRRLAIALVGVATLLGGSAAAEEHCPGDGPLSPCFEDADASEYFYGRELLWQRAGSTGLVDEGSLSRFSMKGREASVRSNRTGTVLLRYPIDCRQSAHQPLLRVWYKDDGRAARVHVKLIEDSFDQLEPRTLVEFDSDSRSSSNASQVYVLRVFPASDPEQDTVDAAIRLACEYASYHIEVRLTRGAGGDPRLMMLGLRGQEMESNVYFP